MYKFFGEPLKIITSKSSGKPLFRFDTKGEYISDDPEIIKRALGFFDYIEMKAEEVGNRVEKTFIETPLTIEKKDEPKQDNIDKSEMSDSEIRAKAKEKGIKSWHTKKIENLLRELKEE